MTLFPDGPNAAEYAELARPFDGLVVVTAIMLRYFLAYLLRVTRAESLEETLSTYLWLVDLNAVIRFMRMTFVVDKRSGNIR